MTAPKAPQTRSLKTASAFPESQKPGQKRANMLNQTKTVNPEGQKQDTNPLA